MIFRRTMRSEIESRRLHITSKPHRAAPASRLREGEEVVPVFCHGLAINLNLTDSISCRPPAHFFLSAVLERFFAAYCSLNSFTELTTTTDKERRILETMAATSRDSNADAASLRFRGATLAFRLLPGRSHGFASPGPALLAPGMHGLPAREAVRFYGSSSLSFPASIIESIDSVPPRKACRRRRESVPFRGSGSGA